MLELLVQLAVALSNLHFRYHLKMKMFSKNQHPKICMTSKTATNKVFTKNTGYNFHHFDASSDTIQFIFPCFSNPRYVHNQTKEPMGHGYRQSSHRDLFLLPRYVIIRI